MWARLLLFLPFVFGPCCVFNQPHMAIAQPPITIVEVGSEPITLVQTEPRQVWSGFVGEKLLGDGKVLMDKTSRPVFSSMTAPQIILTLGAGYEVTEILAEAVPSLEDAEILEATLPDGTTELSFDPDQAPGVYRITVKAHKKGVTRQAIKRLNVTIGKPEPPGPTPPGPDELTPLAKASREAVQALVAGMAADMEKAAVEVEAGRLTKVLDLAAFTVPLDVNTRNTFKKSMAGPMEAAIGKDALTPASAKSLREVAAGFRSAK